MSELEDRSYMAIQNRLKEFKTGLTPQEAGMGRKRRAWSAEEKTLLLEKQQQGLKLGGIASNFPDRSYSSVKQRLHRLHLWPDAPKSTANNFPKELTQRIIDMRLKEAKSLAEIAPEFKCTQKLIDYLWAQRCVKMLSREELDSVHRHRNWTPHEWKRLLELHHQGTLCVQDVALQFPSKTFTAVSVKASRQQLRFPRYSEEPEALVTKRQGDEASAA
ncbi:hypothetical protein Q7P35_008128 [Cladosporium inversicolor]